MEKGRPTGYDWDDQKAALNLKTHNLSFEEAVGIFDGIVYTVVDDRFDYGEAREISIGYSHFVTILTVAHTDRDGITRIISARRASKKERRMFDDYIKRTIG